MIRTVLRRGSPALLALVGLFGLSATWAHAQGGPIPIASNSVFYYRFDVKIGPSAFARPAGPWYSYFPVDPNLLAQPRAAAYPNWPTQFPSAPAGPGAAPAGMTYNAPPANPYGYSAGFVDPAGYFQQPTYWYGR